MRLGLIPYLVLIGALCAAQYGAVTSLEGSNLIVGALILVQLVKVPVAAARARDLGFDGDEAVLTMLPIGNLALFWKLFARTPSDEVRASRQAVHVGESTAWQLIRGALAGLGPTGLVVLPACVLVGLVDALITDLSVRQLDVLIELPPETLVLYSQVAMGVTVLLFLYTAIQFSKRAVASRASWFPSVFLPTGIGLSIAPYMLSSLGNTPDPQQAGQIGLVFLGFAAMPIWAIGSAWAACVAHLAAKAHASGERAGFEVYGAAASRLREIAGPHAGARYLIAIGLQIFVLPGLMYAMRYAMIDQVAWEEPQARSMVRSGELSRGHRQRILRAILIVAVAVGLVQLGVLVVDYGGIDKMMEWVINPFTLSLQAALVGSLAYALGFAVFELAMTRMYAERIAATEDAPEPSADPAVEALATDT